MKVARLATGLSTVALAERQGEHPTTVRRRESGSRSFPFEHVSAMARRARCTLRWLAWGEPNEAPAWLARFDHVRADGSLFQRVLLPTWPVGPAGYLVRAAELLNNGSALSLRDAFDRGLAETRESGRPAPSGAQIEVGWRFFRDHYREPTKAA